MDNTLLGALLFCNGCCPPTKMSMTPVSHSRKWNYGVRERERERERERQRQRERDRERERERELELL